MSLNCFWCEIVKGCLVLKEAEDAMWIKRDQLYDVKWLLIALSRKKLHVFKKTVVNEIHREI